MLLEFCEAVIIGALLLVSISQIFYPLWRGTPLFPFFRREHALRNKLAEEKQVTVEEDLKDEINKEKKR